MCPTIAEGAFQTGAGTPSASKDTPSGSENGETLQKTVFKDVVSTLTARCDFVPKILLWL